MVAAWLALLEKELSALSSQLSAKLDKRLKLLVS
jgi:hypothetical protein